MTKLNSKTPTGDIEKRWDKHLVELSLIAPQNRAKYNIIVIGTGPVSYTHLTLPTNREV